MLQPVLILGERGVTKTEKVAIAQLKVFILLNVSVLEAEVEQQHWATEMGKWVLSKQRKDQNRRQQTRVLTPSNLEKTRKVQR